MKINYNRTAYVTDENGTLNITLDELITLGIIDPAEIDLKLNLTISDNIINVDNNTISFTYNSNKLKKYLQDNYDNDLPEDYSM